MGKMAIMRLKGAKGLVDGGRAAGADRSWRLGHSRGFFALAITEHAVVIKKTSSLGMNNLPTRACRTSGSKGPWQSRAVATQERIAKYRKEKH